MSRSLTHSYASTDTEPKNNGKSGNLERVLRARRTNLCCSPDPEHYKLWQYSHEGRSVTAVQLCQGTDRNKVQRGLDVVASQEFGSHVF